MLRDRMKSKHLPRLCAGVSRRKAQLQKSPGSSPEQEIQPCP